MPKIRIFASKNVLEPLWHSYDEFEIGENSVYTGFTRKSLLTKKQIIDLNSKAAPNDFLSVKNEFRGQKYP